ncbi:MAG: replication-associated recombination protein A [bacterium]
MDLFPQDSSNREDLPLPIRIRPKSINDFAGQDHILGEGKMLRRAIEAQKLSSAIFHGPPGTGKTTLANIIANTVNAHFIPLNAVVAKVEDIRLAINDAKKLIKAQGRRTIVFIDEIHRFNKLQQDALLPDVEEGTIILIGATVENPYFSVISGLVSRSSIFELKPLIADNLKQIVERALKEGLSKYKVKMDEKALDHLIKASNGDARRILNALELGVLTTRPDKKGFVNFNLEVAEESIQRKAVVYDKKGDNHYDTISAFIKSMRGSNPDAALYWLAKMIYAGEDPRFIARRIVICAAEDVGNADPHALLVANSAMQIAEFVGLPEARIPLAQATVYIACAPKSNAAYLGIEEALKDVANEETEEVPEHLKNAVYKAEKEAGKGAGYKYAHSFDNGIVAQDYKRTDKIYYEPKDIGIEARIKTRLDEIRKKMGRKES